MCRDCPEKDTEKWFTVIVVNDRQISEKMFNAGQFDQTEMNGRIFIVER